MKTSIFEHLPRGIGTFLRDESGMSRIDCAVIQLILLALVASSLAVFTGDFGEQPAETAVQPSTETGAMVLGMPVEIVFWLLGAVAAVIIIRLAIELQR